MWLLRFHSRITRFDHDREFEDTDRRDEEALMTRVRDGEPRTESEDGTVKHLEDV